MVIDRYNTFILYCNILYDNERQIFHRRYMGGGGGGVLRPPITTPTPGQALTGAWRVRLSMAIIVKLDQMNH